MPRADTRKREETPYSDELKRATPDDVADKQKLVSAVVISTARRRRPCPSRH